MKVGLWSTTAASNNSTPPDGWPEGQLPSTVNDCAREMMAQIRTMINDLQFIDLGHNISRTGNTTFAVVGDQTAFYTYGRRVKALDSSTQIYGTVVSASFTANTGVTIRIDNGAALVSPSAIAVSVLDNKNWALPDVAQRGYRNIIQNGAFDIWQVGIGYQISQGTSPMITADRWGFQMAGAMNVTVNQDQTTSPSLNDTGRRVNNVCTIAITVADTAIASADFLCMQQCIEGFEWNNIAHQPMVLSFWTRTNTTGTYCVAFQNGANDRAFVAEYSISQNSVWEKKTITVPEAPTTGTWNYSNSCGLRVIFTLANGGNRQAAAGAWVNSGSAISTSNQINFARSTGNAIQFGLIQLEKGLQATPFEMRPYNQEIKLVQRYRCVLGTNGTQYLGVAVNTNRALYNIPFPIEMNRSVSAGDIVFASLGAYIGFGGGGSANTSVAVTINGSSDKHIFFDFSGGALFTLGQASWLNHSAGTFTTVTTDMF